MIVFKGKGPYKIKNAILGHFVPFLGVLTSFKVILGHLRSFSAILGDFRSFFAIFEPFLKTTPISQKQGVELSKHDSVQAELDELTASIQDLASIEQDVRNKVEKSEQGVHWSCVMMEILISIMTKESKLLRKGAVDSFRQIVEDMDVEAITILGKDIMGQEANTEGYGLGVHEEMETDSEDDEEEEDEEEVDEKDESDEEMMDDSKNESSKSEKNNDSDDSSEDEAEKNNVDTELRSKLQAVLGKLLKYYFF